MIIAVDDRILINRIWIHESVCACVQGSGTVCIQDSTGGIRGEKTIIKRWIDDDTKREAYEDEGEIVGTVALTRDSGEAVVWGLWHQHHVSRHLSQVT